MTTQQNTLVTVTDKAQAELAKLFAEEKGSHPDIEGLRLGVAGGGCSGFSYVTKFDVRKDKDHELMAGGVPVGVRIPLGEVESDLADVLEARPDFVTLVGRGS